MSEEEREVAQSQWNRRKFISFGALAAFGLSAFGAWEYITGSEKVDRTYAPLRRVLSFNEGVNARIKSEGHLAREYPRAMAAHKVRVNGYDGLRSALDIDQWMLNVRTGHSTDALMRIGLSELRALPKTEVIFEFKCIEGWSQISHWGGVRFRDVAENYLLGTRNGKAPSAASAEELFGYVGMRTPDNGYYVSLDMASAMHPQTILAYEMNGAPLPTNNGAPLRLIVPTKYGVKNLKRIGTIAFSDERPPDYWAERGYDHDAAL